MDSTKIGYSVPEKIHGDGRKLIQKDNHFLFIIAAVCFIILLLSGITPYYEYFRDEFYYIACSKRLAFGYVDHPPFSIFVLSLWTALFGESIVALRIISSLSGSATIFITMLIAQELGGRKFAQGMAALSVMIAPLFLGINSFYSMNTLEILIWTACSFFIIKLLKTNNARYCIFLGILAGIGILNKHTFAVFVFGLFAGLVFTDYRKQLVNKWFWTGVIIAFIILLPNLIWQIINGFPSLEFYRNADLYKNIKTSPFGIIMGQILTIHPLNFPIWLAGLFYFMKVEGKTYRVLGWIYLICLFLMIISQSSRPDRLTALYPMLLAGGSVFTEKMITEAKRFLLRPVIPVVLFISGLITAPLTTTILPPKQLSAYAGFLGFKYQFEKGKKAQLPQFLADRLGWNEMAYNAAQVYSKLSSEEKKTAAIFTGNYGEAGALELYSKRYELPPVLSGHNNYFFWGFGCPDFKIIIGIGIHGRDLQKVFNDVKIAAWHKTSESVMEYENNIPIYIARDPKHTFKQIWPGAKHLQ